MYNLFVVYLKLLCNSFPIQINITFLTDSHILKFIYFEKATKLCVFSTLLLTTVHTVKSKVEISQNFVAFSEYMNFIRGGPIKEARPNENTA